MSRDVCGGSNPEQQAPSYVATLHALVRNGGVRQLAGNEPARSARVENESGGDEPADGRKKAYGHAAYGTGEIQTKLEEAGIESGCKPTRRVNRTG